MRAVVVGLQGLGATGDLGPNAAVVGAFVLVGTAVYFVTLFAPSPRFRTTLYDNPPAWGASRVAAVRAVLDPN